MAMPALDLLEAAGFSLYLVGKSFIGELFQGTNRRFDPIEGSVLNDIRRIKELAATVENPKGLLLPNSFGSALLFRWAGIQCTGLATDGRSPLLTYAIPEPPHMHEVERFWYVAYEALKAWNITPPYDKIPAQLNMKLAKRNEAGARNLIHKVHLPEKFALLAPIAKGRHEGKAKYWRHFNELVEPLKERGLTPVIFPAEDEYEASRLSCPDAMIYNPTSLGNFASLCSKATIVIANDSGVSHIAAAVHAPQVTIVGVTDVERTKPWNDLNVTVGRKGKWPETQEVIEAIDKVLARNK